MAAECVNQPVYLLCRVSMPDRPSEVNISRPPHISDSEYELKD